jgi:Ca2+-binding RTX toxin-like protein
MLRCASSTGHMQIEGGCAVVRQGHLIAVVRAFLIGCAFLLLIVGGSPEATASEEARCERTRTYDYQTKDPTIVLVFTTNDIPGCTEGGLLSGTDKRDLLNGKDGEDKVRGLGGPDNLYGGSGNDVLYGGPDGDYELIGGQGDDVLHGGDGGDSFEAADKSKSASVEGDDVLYGDDGGDTLWGRDEGKDVLYGGDGNDILLAERGGGQDKLYCGKGKDQYVADKNDYVDSSCEKGELVDTGGPPLLLLAGAALCSGLMMLRYVIRSA